MLLPENVRNALAKRYRARCRNWLTSEDRWPLSLSLGCPSECEAQRQRDAVLAWVSAWRSWQGPGELVWIERRWRSLGAQVLPERLLLHEPESVAAWIGEEKRWERASGRHRHFIELWPALAPRLSRNFELLADYDAEDIQRLEDLLAWLECNPASNLYTRQLPVGGLDTKWLEGRMPLINDLLAAIRGDLAGNLDFFERCGLKRPPHLVRLCILDDRLRERIGGIRDLSTQVADLARLDLPASKVLIVENLQTGLAFADQPGSVVFMGLGYGVTALARLPWVKRERCIYWGDIDSHGFAILSRARSCLPNLQSALMDEGTLLTYKSLWVKEKDQYPVLELPLPDSRRTRIVSGIEGTALGA